MFDKSFITLHRKLLKSAVFSDAELLKVWIWCLIRANHKDCDVVHAGQVLHVKRGQFVTGRFSASEELNMSAMKWRKRIADLEKLKQISQKTTNRFTIITVVNYSYYQGGLKKTTNKQPTNNQQTTTDNNVNNENNNISGLQPDQLKDNNDDMGWNKYSEDYEEGTVDYDSGEFKDPEEEKKKEVRELNEKIRHNLRLVEEARGLPFGKGKDLNYHVKIYRELLDKGWSHQSLIEAMLELVNSDYWKGQRITGQYPGMNTVQSSLRNRKPI